jgi:adenylylsulfate kinase
MRADGFTVWFTGLPSSGKSTLAGLLAGALRERGRPVEVLDGDEVRRELTRGLGFSREDRDENIRRIAYVAKVLTRNGVVAIAAAISPYRAARERARAEIGRFVEVYVSCPVEVCMQRDVKGLYARALRGEIPQFTGVSDPYEEPLSPEVVVHSDRQSPQDSLRQILTFLEGAGYLQPGTATVDVPAYLVERLRRRWGEAFQRKVVEVLASHAEGTPAVVSPEDEQQILTRLRSLGYLD